VFTRYLSENYHFNASYVSAFSCHCATTRVDGSPVNSASGNRARQSTRPVLTGNGNRSPVNSGRQLGQWKPGLTRRSAVTVVNSLIVTRLDYWDSLLAGCNKQLIDKLQHVLNCAARVIFGGNCRDHITPLLRNNLHWLRVRERITFKLYLLVYKAMNELAPSYIKELCLCQSQPSLRALLSAL